MSKVITITAPTVFPVFLPDVKRQLRLTGTAEDALLDLYVRAATEYYEARTWRAVYHQTLEYLLDAFPAGDTIKLPRATPLQSITSLKYKDSDGTETTWGASNYIADTDSTPGQLVLAYNIVWPSFTAYPVHPIRVRYVAGRKISSPFQDAPASLKVPILMLVNGLYENRESVVLSDRNAVNQIAVEYGVEAFINQMGDGYGITEFVF